MRKLAEIHGEEAMELTAMLVSIGRKITADRALKKYIGKPAPPGKDVDEYNTEFAGEFFNVLFLKHKKDCIRMLAKIEGVEESAYLDAVTPAKVTKDVGDLMKDREFCDLFFASAQSQISGSASANIPE